MARIGEPWPENFVDWQSQEAPKLLGDLRKILDEADDERPLQGFYTDHPYFLVNLFVPRSCWIFAKPRLGAEYIPDFLYCEHNSLGYRWIVIELESPKVKATNKNGSVSAKCHHAVDQILDYRRWLAENALAVQKRYRGLDAKCGGLVVIGRRGGERSEFEQKRLAEFRDQRIEVASYDRLFDDALEWHRFISGALEFAEWPRKVKLIWPDRRERKM